MPNMTTHEAAAALGYTTGHVRALAIAKTLKGAKVGRDWQFTTAAIAAYKARREGKK